MARSGLQVWVGPVCDANMMIGATKGTARKQRYRKNRRMARPRTNMRYRYFLSALGRCANRSLVPPWCLPGASLVPPWCLLGASLVPPWCLPGASLHPLTWSQGTFCTPQSIKSGFWVPFWTQNGSQHRSQMDFFG